MTIYDWVNSFWVLYPEFLNISFVLSKCVVFNAMTQRFVYSPYWFICGVVLFLQILSGLVYLCMNVFQWRMLLVFWGWGEKRKFDRVSWETSLVLAVADWPYPLPHRVMRRTELNISGTSHNPPVFETDAFKSYDAFIKPSYCHDESATENTNSIFTVCWHLAVIYYGCGWLLWQC